MSIVRKFSNEKGAWHYYDTNFRKNKAACNLSWDQIHSELYVTALSRKQSLRFRSGRDLSDKERSRTTIPGTCNKYNRGIFCSGCDYRHICKYSNCGGNTQGINVGKISGHEAAVTLPSRTNQTSNSPPINLKVNPMDPNHTDLPTPVRWKILDKY